MSLCTVDEVALYLGLDSSDDLALLESLVSAAQGMIERHTGRRFDVETATARYLHATRDVFGRSLWLGAELAAAPTSVVNGNGVTVTSNQYVLEPRNDAPYYALTLLGSSGVTWTYTTDPEGAIAVTGKWGYSTTPPAEVKHACVRLAAFLYRQRDNSGDSDRAIVTPGGTVKPLTLPQDVTVILAPYVRTT